MADLFGPADPTTRRLGIIGVLVVSLVLTLIGRLYFVQELDPSRPSASGEGMHNGTIVVPAPRGQIVDALGRPLVDNVVTHQITLDRQALLAQSDQGLAVLTRVAGLLKTKVADLSQEITPCSSTVPAPCWTGEPYQPVPVATNASTAAVLAVSEHRELYPGVAVTTQSEPNYPGGSLAAHVLGYTGAVSADDEKLDKSLNDADSIGRTGLEEQYDRVLRGTDGSQTVQLDAAGNVVGGGKTVAAQSGDTLVTSIDANVQALAEKALTDQIAASRTKGDKATSGAVVVMDPNTGRIIAAASYPTYDPQVFIGGISVADYQKLTAPSANDPLVGRAIDGQYAPGSTFKLITSSSDVMNGEIGLDGRYPCPGSLTVDGRVKTNYDSESFGYPLTLAQALQVSCDTFFYAPAVNEYEADQNTVDHGAKPTEHLQKMATAFGIGSATGVDLPAGEQASGSYADRETRLARWNANKAQYCADAKKGFPTEKDPAQRAYLTELAKENCTDGWRYRAGDNADMAIGQGETTVSPLQLAVAYSALLNGGTIWQPTIGWGVVNPAGKLVQTIKPVAKSKVPVNPDVLGYIANALHFDAGHTVSGALAFDGAPYKTELGGKTGTAEVFGQQDTSWLASWGPVSTSATGTPTAKFVVVGMIEQGGTGASSAAPMLRTIYNGLLGAGTPPVLAGSTPEKTLPRIAPTVGAAQTGPATTAVPSGGAATKPGIPRSPVHHQADAPNVVPTPAARIGKPT